METETRGSKPRVAILLGYDQDPSVWRQRHAAGETLDETPYGYQLAQQWCDLTWARSHPESAFTGRVRRRIASILGYDLVHAWRNRRIIQASDVVWTHTEREHLAVAALPLRRRPHVVAQSVWLWDNWPGLSPRRRRRIAALLQRHSVEITLSPENARISAEAVPGRRVAFIPFGTRVSDRAAATEVAVDRRIVLAPGNDVHRDWTLLRDVAARLPQVRFRVATRRAAALGLEWPPNADVGAATVDELRDLYGRCSAVAVPLRHNSHASGVTVCLEAIGARLPLVATDTGGLAAYFGDEATLVPEHDVEGFARAIVVAMSGDRPAADTLTRRGLTQPDYVRRFVHLTRAVLSGAWDESISALGPVPAP
jgi:glycosyltransferase involved in cell wall biosynthesis